ncbi:MAG TPA: DUF58 domain-containing protein [Clostridiales bacterium]|nr:DUF58 domain-containing protein [Clostridiales bacterium]HOL91677.1 DUF58 domain-containing protein [Clostridiales bacterium]HPP35462.1 DUF58 domain-containing protein [Clostridiales bacterium]
MDVIALLLILAFVLWLQLQILCRFVFSRLEYKCEFSVPEAHEGDTIMLVETVYNGKLMPVPWLRVDIHTSRWLEFAGTCSVIAQDNRHVTSSFVLKSYQKITRKWKLKCIKRGIFQTENVTLVSGDLLNFTTVSIAVPVNATLTVYPQIIDLEELFVPVSLQQSDRVVNRWIIDDPFLVAGVRDYTYGDPFNRMHWPASAKNGRLMVRKNEYTTQQNLTVILNMQSRHYELLDTVDKAIAELGIKVAATLFDRALRNGNPVRFITNGCTDPDAKQPIVTGEAADRDHITSLLRILAGLKMKNIKDFRVLLEDTSSDIYNSEVVIITAYLTVEISRLADRMASEGNDVHVVLLDSVYERGSEPRHADLYVLSDRIRAEAEKLA